MFEWCKNRLEITGRSVFIDVMLQWVTGDEVPLYRYAVQQSIQLFLASSAGGAQAGEKFGGRNWGGDLSVPVTVTC